MTPLRESCTFPVAHALIDLWKIASKIQPENMVIKEPTGRPKHLTESRLGSGRIHSRKIALCCCPGPQGAQIGTFAHLVGDVCTGDGQIAC